MFKMDFFVPNSLMMKNNYSKMTIDEIYDFLSYDAELTITNNDSVFFSEEVPIVEFYWHLCNWYRKKGLGKEISFEYNTIEHSASILSFRKSVDDCWIIDSIWKQSKSPIAIDEKEFICELHALLKKLISVLEG